MSEGEGQLRSRLPKSLKHQAIVNDPRQVKTACTSELLTHEASGADPAPGSQLPGIRRGRRQLRPKVAKSGGVLYALRGMKVSLE